MTYGHVNYLAKITIDFKRQTMRQNDKEINSFYGYQSKEYAKSFQEVGTPCQLSKSLGWLIIRKIPDCQFFDAMGCYPFMICSDWVHLESDLSEIKDEIITLTVITDPAGNYTKKLLEHIFPELCTPFKEHFVVELQTNWKQSISSNHKRNAQKAVKNIEIEYVDNPHAYIHTWCRLYGNLIKRHKITGITKFSPEAFDQQLRAPGIGAHRAIYNGQTVGMVLWYIHDQHVYYHLGAYDELGYENKVSFAIFIKAFEQFADQGKKQIYLGAGAGLNPQADDGLTRFKRGWANNTRTVYLCGRILNKKKYDLLVKEFGPQQMNYFPAYRSPEFG